ncbi:MAG: hypothetical protein KKH79_10320 [Candidatus Thermoplasmatota archaeon]|nr:hypothetical protein [Candidatus Thermoplasmatota archaeon]
MGGLEQGFKKSLNLKRRSRALNQTKPRRKEQQENKRKNRGDENYE